MKHRPMIVKVAVIACSLTLVGCYVGYRASSTPEPVQASDPGPPPTGEEQKEEFFVGTKSAAVFKPEAQPAAHKTLPGSKVMVPVIEPSDAQLPPTKQPEQSDPPAQPAPKQGQPQQPAKPGN
jgi:hypothetical protein